LSEITLKYATKRLPSDAGIAIGPILFVVAILGLLAVIMASGIGDYGTASVADRVKADIVSQGNLIRTKINECNIIYLSSGTNGDGYPANVNLSTGDDVSTLTCEGDVAAGLNGNLWSGARATQLPPPTHGFQDWYYVNDAAAGGGRCIWTQPLNGANSGITAGLTSAATKFSSQEYIYNPAGATQRFVIWITLPSGTADSLCQSL